MRRQVYLPPCMCCVFLSENLSEDTYPIRLIVLQYVQFVEVARIMYRHGIHLTVIGSNAFTLTLWAWQMFYANLSAKKEQIPSAQYNSRSPHLKKGQKVVCLFACFSGKLQTYEQIMCMNIWSNGAKFTRNKNLKTKIMKVVNMYVYSVNDARLNKCCSFSHFAARAHTTAFNACNLKHVQYMPIADKPAKIHKNVVH